MGDRACAELLRWALPRLGKRWEGFRDVRGQVCKRVARRARAVGAPDLAAYRAHLEAHAGEWAVLDELTRVTISRFGRDRAVFEALAALLPALAEHAAAEGRGLRAWSAGCASGEEPYTLAILWRLELAPRFPGVDLAIVATDLDDEVLARARGATYDDATLAELPAAWRAAAFRSEGSRWTLDRSFRDAVDLRRGDVRRDLPDGPLDAERGEGAPRLQASCAGTSPSRTSTRRRSAASRATSRRASRRAGSWSSGAARPSPRT